MYSASVAFLRVRRINTEIKKKKKLRLHSHKNTNDNNQAIASNHFYCKCNSYEHKNSHVSHNSGKEKIVSSKSEKLNSIFVDDSNSENKEHDNLIDPNSHHFQEQYLQIQSTKLLIFNKKKL